MKQVRSAADVIHLELATYELNVIAHVFHAYNLAFIVICRFGALAYTTLDELCADFSV